jgi:hypothetical protein
MYQDPYNGIRQQTTFQPDSSLIGGGYDFFTKIMGFSLVASLFGGLGNMAGDGDQSGGAAGGLAGGGMGSYFWNTISLFLLGLLRRDR